MFEKIITIGIQSCIAIAIGGGGYVFNSIRVAIAELNANLKESNKIMNEIEKRHENVSTRVTTIEKQVTDLYHFKNEASERIKHVETVQSMCGNGIKR